MSPRVFSYINPDVVPTLQSPSSDVKANGRVLVTGGGGSLMNAKNRATSEMEDESEEVETSSKQEISIITFRVIIMIHHG